MFLLAQQGVSTKDPSNERRNYLGEKCRKYATWDKRLYLTSERRRAEDFFALKNPTASAGFEPANLGTKGQHATSRPPKPLHFPVTCFALSQIFFPSPRFQAH